MKTFQQFHILFLIILCTAAQSQSRVHEKSQLRQNNFLEWLISIFQFNPITVSTLKPPVILKPPTESRECPSCTCGKVNVINRIVGGEETQEIRYPWMTLLKNRNSFYCGGSLISDRYVATAAHCLDGLAPSRISITLLVHDRRENCSREINRKVKNVRIHEDYDPDTVNNDFGLLELSESVEMSDVLRPVCMPMKNKTYEGETGIATGWGATSEGGHTSQKLMQVSLPIISNDECSKKFFEDLITENMMCAGVPKGNKDPCQGDSGGPFIVYNNDLDIFHLAGVVSWGEGCARPNKPGVYARVTQYLEWIEKHTNDSCRCDMPSGKLAEQFYWEIK